MGWVHSQNGQCKHAVATHTYTYIHSIGNSRDESRERNAVPDGVVDAADDRRGASSRLAPHDGELKDGRVGRLVQGLLRQHLQVAEERVHPLAREDLLHHVLGGLQLVGLEHLPEPLVIGLDLARPEAAGGVRCVVVE